MDGSRLGRHVRHGGRVIRCGRLSVHVGHGCGGHRARCFHAGRHVAAGVPLGKLFLCHSLSEHDDHGGGDDDHHEADADEHVALGGRSGLFLFLGELGLEDGLLVVAHAVAVAVEGFTGVVGEGVSVVAHTVAVAVGPFGGVGWEHVGVHAVWIVTVPVVVGVGPLRGFVDEEVGVGALNVIAVAVPVLVGGLGGVVRESVAVVAHAVAVGVNPLGLVLGEGIGVVACRVVAVAVTVTVGGLRPVFGEHVSVVAHAVHVGVGGFERIFREGVGVVAHAVFVVVRSFSGVVGRPVAVITHAVAVAVNGFIGVVGENVCVVADAVKVRIKRFVGVVGEGVCVVAHTVVVRVQGFACIVGEDISVVAHAVVVRIEGFACIVGEGIGIVAHAVAVRIGGFGAVQREGIGVVTHAVVVRIGRFAGVVGEGVLAVEHTVAVGIDVEDGDFVAHDGVAEFKAVVRGDLDLPLLSRLGQGWLDGGLSVVCSVVGAVHVPVDFRLAGFRIAVVVGIVVGERQGFVVVSLRRGCDEDVGHHGGVVGWKTFRDDDLERAPSIARVGGVAVGIHDGHVDGGCPGTAERCHPVKRPLNLVLVRVGGAVALLGGLNPGPGVHQLAFVDLHVEATAGRVGAGLDADGDGIHGAGDVGGGEVVSNGRASKVAVTSATLSGLTVPSGGVAFNGRDGRHEEHHHGDDEEAGWGVHSLRIVTLHIIKLVHRPRIAPQDTIQNHRGAIK